MYKVDVATRKFWSKHGVFIDSIKHHHNIAIVDIWKIYWKGPKFIEISIYMKDVWIKKFEISSMYWKCLSWTEMPSNLEASQPKTFLFPSDRKPSHT